MSKPTQQGITFSKNDVEIIARETLYRGFFSLDLYRFRHRLFNGGMSGEITREIFERGHAAVLLPLSSPCNGCNCIITIYEMSGQNEALYT